MPTLLEIYRQQVGGTKELVPPIPHYPYWRYLCPICGEPWEGELQRTNYLVPCPDCQNHLPLKIEPEKEDKQ